MITRILIAINVAAFFWELHTGALTNPRTMYDDGALYPRAVIDGGQWWRIVTGAFLHGGWAHIGLNMLSLFWLGRFIELVLGRWRMLAIYAVSLVASGLGVVYLSNPDSLTIGASGAIFGLFGALFAIGFKLGERGRDLVRANLGILVLNLVFTFAMPGISWQAHVAGLLSGFVMTLAIFWPPRPAYARVVDRHTGAEFQSTIEPPPR